MMHRTKVAFHKFPKDPKLRKQWSSKIKRVEGKDGFNIKPCTKVCSLHFSENDYVRKVANGSKLLMPNATPSIFPWTSKTKVRDSWRERAVVSQNLQLNESVELVANHVEKGVQENEEQLNVPVQVEMEVADDSMTEDTSENVETQDCQRCSEIEQSLLARIRVLETELNEKKKSVSFLENELGEIKAKYYKLCREKELLNIKYESCEKEKKMGEFNLDRFQDSEADIYFYTGIPNYQRLMAIYKFLDPGDKGENIILWNPANDMSSEVAESRRPRSLAPIEQFFLTLVRLRLGLYERDLAHRFRISQSTVSKITVTWINFMYSQLSQINLWPSRELIDRTMPEEFRNMYPTTRVIIDATELKCEVPQSLVLQSNTYSNYKSSNTFKGLIGITPTGHVSFVSKLFSGNISDKELTRRSGLLQIPFKENDSVMADKGFLIEEDLNKIGVELNIPPFLENKGQFSKDEIERTGKIAALRIHVERRIRRVKAFHIFSRTVPITLAPVINQMWTVCAILCNFQHDIVKHTE